MIMRFQHGSEAMATRSTLPSQKSGTHVAASGPDHKTKILQCLTRLNDKATLQKAAEDLSVIIRALDYESLAALVQSICSTGAWEPKPFAKKECLRTLGQLPVHTCPVADVVLNQYLSKILGHLKKQLQDTDSLVRDAACETLSAYAWAMTEASGSPLPGSMSSPVVKVLFDCLSEQKKEAQLGASQALLMVSPCMAPLDKDLVRLILRMLKSPTFQGTAPLLAAIASSSSETHAPVGLLKSGSSAFEPYLNHLIGQPSMRRSSPGLESTAGNSQSNSNSGSGIIGCLASKDWTVRRAAADALRASVLLLGPQLEPEGCWTLGDSGSLTHRCLNALDSHACKFDKVREARDAARDAASLLHELHRFVQEEGPAGDWSAWIRGHVTYSGCVSPASPTRVGTSSGDLTDRWPAAAMRTSPISQRFQQAAVQDGVIAEPGGVSRMSMGLPDEDTAEESNSSAVMEDSPTTAVAEQENVAVGGPLPEGVGFEVTLYTPEQQSADEQQPHPDAQPRTQLSQSSSTSGAAAANNCSRAVSRTGNAGASRPGSATGSRRSTAEQQQLASRRQSTHSLASKEKIAAAATEQPAAGAREPEAERNIALVEAEEGPVAAVAAGPGVPVPFRPSSRSSSSVGVQHRQPSRQSSSSRARAVSAAEVAPAGTTSAWVGPTQQEWQQMQQTLQQYQQQQVAMASTIRHLQESYSEITAALQERILRLEEQQQHFSGDGSNQFPTAPQGLGSPSRFGRSNSNTAAATPGQSGAVTPAGVLAAAAGRSSGRWGTESGQTGQHDGRMFRSEDWSTPNNTNASAGRRPGLSVLDTVPAGHRFSGSGTNTPTSTGAMKGWECQMQTPSDLDAAYADALHGDKGDVHLLRLIQKTGPVWGKLSPRTSRDLLVVFIKNVKDDVMLHRVLPWLWRLADEVADRPELPVELQQQLLDALQTCPAAEDLQTSEKVTLLKSILTSVWFPR